MKGLAAIVCLGIVGCVHAQTTSRDVEIYERYENGELVEQRQSATENGVPIKDFDFEKAKRDMVAKSEQLEQKMKEMQAQFEQKRKEFEVSMDEKKKSFDQRLSDFEKRSEEMHQKMDQGLKDMEEKNEEKKIEKRESPSKVEKPVLGESTEKLKFT